MFNKLTLINYNWVMNTYICKKDSTKNLPIHTEIKTSKNSYILTQNEEIIKNLKKENNKNVFHKIAFNSIESSSLKKECEMIIKYHGEGILNILYYAEKEKVVSILDNLTSKLRNNNLGYEFSSYGAKFFLERMDEKIISTLYEEKRHTLHFDYLEFIFDDIIIITGYCYNLIYRPILNFIENDISNKNYLSLEEFLIENRILNVSNNLLFDKAEKKENMKTLNEKIWSPNKTIKTSLQKNIKNKTPSKLISIDIIKEKVFYVFSIHNKLCYVNIHFNENFISTDSFSESFIYWIGKLYELNEDVSFVCVIDGILKDKRLRDIILDYSIGNNCIIRDDRIFITVNSFYENFIYLCLLNIYYADQLLLDD